MANAPMGSDFIQGVLGVVRLTFDGTELGKTVDEANIEFIEDIKDIMFAQDGTQPSDKVPTGQAYQVTCKLGQQTWARLDKLMRGVTIAGDGSVALGADLYRSGKDTFSKVLVITRVDSDGDAWTDPMYRLTFYKAFPTVTGPIANFGPDTQRTVDVQFYMFRDSTHDNAFGFMGYSTSLGL